MKKLRKLIKNPLFPIIAGLLFFVPAFIIDHVSADAAGTPTLSIVFYFIALVISGGEVFADAVRGIFHKKFLDEKFLMSIASVGAVCIGEYEEGVAVMIFYLVGEYFQKRAVEHSRSSIRSLMDIRPDEATVLRDGKEERVDADDVKVGETLIIRAGERVPLDARITSGTADVDTSALTGESIPRSVGPDDTLDSGTVVLNGTLYLSAIRPAEDSAAARILDLVENAGDRKSKEENFITKFARYYTPFVVACAVLLAFIPPIFGWMPIVDSVHRALLFLVVSCPCALVISVPMAFFGGIGGAASQGILYKGGNTFSPLAHAQTFAMDKTGTLTDGTFKVRAVYPVGVSSDELLSLAAAAEYGSHHPMALCLFDAVSAPAHPEEQEEIAGKGVRSVVNGKTVLVGNKKLLAEAGIRHADLNLTVGAGVLFVARDGEYLGRIEVSDRIKPEAKEAIAALRALGVKKTVMLSGDRKENAERVGHELGIDEVNAELLPNQKYEHLEAMTAAGNGVAYVGDGINDAPSLARADIGIAMGGIGSDSAIEAADVVIMSDALDRLPAAVAIARKTLLISKENIVFALGVKAAILILGALGLVSMWWAVFADVGVAILAILNSIRMLRYHPKYGKKEA